MLEDMQGNRALVPAAALMVLAVMGSAEIPPTSATMTSLTSLQPDGLVTVVAIGDVLPGVFYDRCISAGQDPFRELVPWLAGADMALANLETPLTSRGTRVKGKRFTFRAPPGNARLLAGAGLDVLGLANNHILDFGPAGLEDTITELGDLKLLWCGAGRNLEEARRPATFVARGKRIAVLAYNLTFPLNYCAGKTKPGTARAEESFIRHDVAMAKASGDTVIVLVHWGREKTHVLRSYQRPLAKAAIESGASLVIGTHPHVAQGVERIGDGVAAYSLGDGVFGGAVRRKEDSLLMRASFGPSGLHSVEFFALNASNADTDYAPRIRTGEAARASLASVIRQSVALGCPLKPAISAEGVPCARLDLMKE